MALAQEQSIADAAEAGLRYVSDSIPGITRERKGTGFSYRRPDGSPVKDERELDRIRKLAIPPAYRKVWICPIANGHLQATGIDARGRKQYRYHTRYREVRDESKFLRMATFGKKLPGIRRRIDHDLSRPGLPKEKVLAVVIYLLERSLIRVGNDEYAKENRSYGLTTMLTRHVKIAGGKIEFTFLGKSKIRHRIEIHDRRLARLVKRIQDLPGQELLHYLNEDGEAHTISSADVNAYLQELSGEPFTAKDFRTWWGTLLTLIELSECDAPGSRSAANRAVSEAMKNVSRQLGNTPAICRKCYVHPMILEEFTKGALYRRVPPEDVEELIRNAERELLRMLRPEKSRRLPD